jgi:hypothetical protein
MASTYLTRTNSSAGSGTKFTISTWVKKGTNASGIPRIMEFYHSSSYYISLRFRDDSSNRLDFYSESNGAGVNLRTNRSFRDTSAWYHIVLAVDTTDATADDRMKMYINGVQETSFALRTNPSSSEDLGYNTSSATNYVGRKWENSDYFNGSMAHFHFIDGTAYAASDFGETDSTTGIWKPKTAPSVTYGTNGFFLKFENSGAFGTDSSGNSNTFTVNGTMTQTIDTPSNVFCTLNPNNASSNCSLENGNTTFGQSANDSGVMANLGFTQGKWYWEFKVVGGLPEGGIILNPMVKSFAALSTVGGTTNNTSLFRIFNNTGATSNFRAMGSTVNTTVGASVTYAVGDIISVAVDADAGKIWFAKNGTYEGSGNPATGASPTYDWSSNLSSIEYIVPAFMSGTGTSSKQQCNFGNGVFGTTAVSSAENPDDGIGIFEYDVPAGYRALCTKSINAEEYD